MWLYDYAYEHWGGHYRNEERKLAPYLNGFIKLHPYVHSESDDPPEEKLEFAVLYQPFCDSICLAAAFELDVIVANLIDEGFATPYSNTQRAGPLHWAVAGGYLDVVSILVDAGADPDQHFRGFRPLAMAIRRESRAMISFLLQKGADPKLKSNRLPPFGVRTTKLGYGGSKGFA